ncbi:hypothetical protein IT575_13445 [bacterium]|nr:hypothetical protein [bacterium]
MDSPVNSSGRSPWPQSPVEFALDGMQWLGIACIALVALSANGLVSPLSIGTLGDPDWLRNNRYFISVLSFVALMEYPSMLLVLASQFRKAQGQQKAQTALMLRLAFAFTPWIYLLILLLRFGRPGSGS